MRKDSTGHALFGEDYFALHRNGSGPLSQSSVRFAVPLWRAVLRYWVGVLIVVAVFGTEFRGHPASSTTWPVPVVAIFGGAAAVGVAWFSKLTTPDRRPLYSA